MWTNIRRATWTKQWRCMSNVYHMWSFLNNTNESYQAFMFNTRWSIVFISEQHQWVISLYMSLMTMWVTLTDGRQEAGWLEIKKTNTQMSLLRRMVRSQMTWAGHLVWMEVGRLPKRAEAMTQCVCWKRVRSHLRWENCIKRDVRHVEEDEKWREQLPIQISGENSCQYRSVGRIAANTDQWRE